MKKSKLKQIIEEEVLNESMRSQLDTLSREFDKLYLMNSQSGYFDNDIDKALDGIDHAIVLLRKALRRQ